MNQSSDGRSHPDSSAFPLSKLIYSLAAFIAIVDFVEPLAEQLLLRKHTPATIAAAIPELYLAQILLPVVVCAVITSLYRPWSGVFSPGDSGPQRRAGLARLVLYGCSGSVAAFVLCIPFFLLSDTQGRFLAGAISDFTSAKGWSLIVLLIVVLPACMEVLFRAIAFRALAVHATVPSAVIASSLLFAHVWPAFGWPVGVILGVLSSLLYRRTNSLVPCILANALLTLSGGAFILYRALARH